MAGRLVRATAGAVVVVGVFAGVVAPADAARVRWSHEVPGSGRAWSVGISTCDTHSAGEGQGVSFDDRRDADALFGHLVKYGARRPGVYRELFVFRGDRRFADVKFACHGIGKGVHS